MGHCTTPPHFWEPVPRPIPVAYKPQPLYVKRLAVCLDICFAVSRVASRGIARRVARQRGPTGQRGTTYTDVSQIRNFLEKELAPKLGQVMRSKVCLPTLAANSPLLGAENVMCT